MWSPRSNRSRLFYQLLQLQLFKPAPILLHHFPLPPLLPLQYQRQASVIRLDRKLLLSSPCTRLKDSRCRSYPLTRPKWRQRVLTAATTRPSTFSTPNPAARTAWNLASLLLETQTRPLTREICASVRASTLPALMTWKSTQVLTWSSTSRNEPRLSPTVETRPSPTPRTVCL